MLKSLTIKNYALIDAISVDFVNGFTVITGETGAGKSIILGALSLVLGKRADLKSITNKSEKCIVEATFDIAQFELESFFEVNELDFELNTIIRRELLPSGKSRAFINDTPVTLDILSQLSTHLLDIHAQHDSLNVADSEFQYQLLDALANQKDKLKNFQNDLKSYHQEKNKFQKLSTQKSELIREQDYNLFLLNELNELPENITALTDLESEYEKLSNAEKIQSSLSEVVQLSNQDEIGVRDLLNKVKSLLANVVQYSESFESLYNRVESVTIELDDIITSIEDESQDLDIEPRRLQELTELINKLQSLYLKHNVNNIDELLEVKEALSDKSILFDSIDESISEIEKNITNLENSLNKQSEALDKARKQIVPTLIKELKESISDLGISNADFEIRLNPNQEFNKFGKTTIEFLFSANKGQSLKSLKNSASGGELSRIMLSIKAIMARYSKLPTLIFDEIDTGVSGDVATKVADIMHTMSSNMQLLSISHLPQIAAKGHAHLKVFKKEENEKTITKLVALNPEERVVEIAEMLSGKQMTTTAIEHAKQLLN